LWRYLPDDPDRNSEGTVQFQGCAPFAGLVQATDGKFNGAASRGGTGAVGDLFQITSTGKYADLFNFKFRSTIGESPFVSLFQHTNGTFY
jgi:hypothetical protein